MCDPSPAPPPTSGDGPRVFVCYARDDLARVLPFYECLKAIGFQPWLDRENLVPGSPWEIEIRKEIRRSDYFLAFLSLYSVNKRGFVQKELRLALETLDLFPQDEVFLVPVVLDKVSLPAAIQRYHYINCSDSDANAEFEKGMRALLQSHAPESFEPRLLLDQENEEQALETKRAVRRIAEAITGREGLVAPRQPTSEEMAFIVSSLGERQKVELLFLYDVVKCGSSKGPYSTHAQTLKLRYSRKAGPERAHFVDWGFDPLYELRKVYGLGDEEVTGGGEEYLVHTVFLDALEEAKGGPLWEEFFGDLELRSFLLYGSTD